MNLDKLGLVILNYNSHKLVIRCIQNILFFYNKSIRIIIVDNNSSDSSFEIFKRTFEDFSNIELLKTDHNGGYSFGNNAGIKYLIKKYNFIEYLAIINPDIEIIDSNIFQNLISKLEDDTSLAGISPLMVVDKKMKSDRWAIKVPIRINNFISSFVLMRKINPLIYRTFDIHPSTLVTYVEVIPGSFFIMKKSILNKINLLDENVFLYGEEIILGKKVKTENLKLGLSFSDLYLHNHSDEGRSLAKKMIHLKHSLISHIYYNSNYNDKFWGILDTLLLFIFLPLKILEVSLIHWYSRSK